jgi:predicted nucleic-acid-binding protein
VLIAVDTNVLLDQAVNDEDVLDAMGVIRDRLPEARLIVPPTVLEELGVQLDQGDVEESAAAERALSCLLEWGFEPLNLIPVGRGISEQISLKLRLKGVVVHEEENDSYIIAEAALIGCAILLSSDHHLLEAQDHPAFRSILRDSDVPGDHLVIATPRKIASQFFRRR